MSRMSLRYGFIALAGLCLLLIPLAGCGGSKSSGDTNGSNNQNKVPVTRVYSYDFDSGGNGWAAGFADLPANPDPSYELAVDPNALLPQSVRGSGEHTKGYRIVSHNRSDDVFSFLKHQVDGLVPGARYHATFTLTFASDAPEDSFGIGGGPGVGVVLKAGATTNEPNAVPQPGKLDFLQMNIDKGVQSLGGANATVQGNVGIPSGTGDYALKTLATPLGSEVAVTADSAGRVWLIVGTDSGFEGKTDLYYTKIDATLSPF